MLGLVSEARFFRSPCFTRGGLQSHPQPPKPEYGSPAQRFLLLPRAWLKDPGVRRGMILPLPPVVPPPTGSDDFAFTVLDSVAFVSPAPPVGRAQAQWRV